MSKAHAIVILCILSGRAGQSIRFHPNIRSDLLFDIDMRYLIFMLRSMETVMRSASSVIDTFCHHP